MTAFLFDGSDVDFVRSAKIAISFLTTDDWDFQFQMYQIEYSTLGARGFSPCGQCLCSRQLPLSNWSSYFKRTETLWFAALRFAVTNKHQEWKTRKLSITFGERFQFVLKELQVAIKANKQQGYYGPASRFPFGGCGPMVLDHDHRSSMTMPPSKTTTAAKKEVGQCRAAASRGFYARNNFPEKSDVN